MANDDQKALNHIETLPYAFARHRIVKDDQDRVVDYVFLTVNAAFEDITGLSREEVVGFKATAVLPELLKSRFDWIGVYAAVARGGGRRNFEEYSEPLQRWYAVDVYSDEPDHFTTIFNEITPLKQELASITGLLQLTEKMLSGKETAIDYKQQAEVLRTLSGAKYTAINTYSEDHKKTTTRAISGLPAGIKRASDLLGFKIEGRTWDISEQRLRHIRYGKLIRYDSIARANMGVISAQKSRALQNLFKIEAVYVLELGYGGRKALGDLIFFMAPGQSLKNPEAVELYASQVGALMGRLQDEKALKKSEKKYRSLIETLQEGIWVIDKAGYTTYVNEVMAGYVGYSVEEMQGLNIYELVDEEGRKKTDAYIKKRAAGIKEQHEAELLHKDGHKITVLMETGPLLDDEGNFTGAIAGVQDITARKKVEEELKYQNLSLKTQQEVALDGILIVDKNDRITSFNCRFAELWGLPGEVMAAQSGEIALEYVLPQLTDPDQFASRIQALYEQKTEKSQEEISLKDGRTLERYSAPMFDESGAYQGRVWYYRDISGRKQMEKATHEQLLFETMLNDISTRFLGLPPDRISEGIDYALEQIGRYFKIDRSYLFEFSSDGELMSNSHEWCNEGIESQMERLQNERLDSLPWWSAQINSADHVYIPDVESLSGDRAAEKKEFQSQGIKSLLSVPLKKEDRLLGFIGFDSVKVKKAWYKDQIVLLQIIAALVASALDRYQHDANIRFLSFHDQLTGLYNRHYFVNEIERLEGSREYPVALISADLDGLKLVNDSFGHQAGDRYLKAGAAVLKGALRSADVLARIGGDEFAVILPRTGIEGVKSVLERIWAGISAYNRDNEETTLSISTGYAVSEDDTCSLEDVFKEADEKMYQKKPLKKSR